MPGTSYNSCDRAELPADDSGSIVGIMRRSITATILALTIVVAGCSDTELSDAQKVWCSDFETNFDAIDNAARQLDLRTIFDFSWEMSGLDLKGRHIEDIPDREFTEVIIDESSRIESKYAAEEFWKLYLYTDDGTRICIAAHDSR